MHDSQPILNIVGEKITLGPLSKDVLPTITRWINDFHALRTLGASQPGPSTIENEEEWYTSTISGKAGITFLIRERSSNVPIGSTSLHAIDHRNRATTFGILIGEHTARGQGYGTEADARLRIQRAGASFGGPFRRGIQSRGSSRI
jgi:RimJ/RimL family protein N-acetyltransferase